MLRLAATYGLTPDQFYRMTLREVELWIQGREDMWSRIMEVLAWMQTNLINIHIAKGRRVTMDDVLPRGVRKKRRMNPRQTLKALKR